MKKIFSAIILSAMTLTAHAGMEPSSLSCKSYGFTIFNPDAGDGNRFQTTERRSNYQDESSTVKINFRKREVSYTMDGSFVVEDLEHIAGNVYKIRGGSSGSYYYGTYIFDEDFVKATYSQSGDYIEFFICQESYR